MKHQQVFAQRVVDALKTVSIYWPWIDSGISHVCGVINVNYLCIRNGPVTPDTEIYTVKKIIIGTYERNCVLIYSFIRYLINGSASLYSRA